MKNDTWWLRNYVFVCMCAWAVVMFALFSLIVFLAVELVQVSDRLARAEGVVHSKGVGCKELLSDPSVARIMSAR